MSNIHNLQRLIYLCQIKNDLNRKRRRFYHLTQNANTSKSYNAMVNYRKAQNAMKAMTSDMRKMRVEMGVSFKWNDGGLIEAIVGINGKHLKQTQFKSYYEAELFEMELFNGK